MKHQGTKKLETERLVLRKFSQDDCENFYNNWASDARVTKYLTWNIHTNITFTRVLLNEWIGNYHNLNYYQWVIQLKDDSQVIGSISAVNINKELEEIEIGYCLGYNYWNKGYTTEALNKIIKYFFEEVKIKKIKARHDSRNIASGKVIKKCGLKYVESIEGFNKGEKIILMIYELSK